MELFGKRKPQEGNRENSSFSTKSVLKGLLEDLLLFLLIFAGGFAVMIAILLIQEFYWARIVAVGAIVFVIIRKINKNKYENRKH